MKNNVLLAIILFVVFINFSQSPKEAIVIDTDAASVASLVDADVSFTGQNKYQSGSALTSEDVRVFKEGADLGKVTLNSGTLSVTPGADYRLYFFMNATHPSSIYYVDVQDHTAKAQDSVDNLIGFGCTIDTSPTIYIKDSSGRVQSATANAEAMAASETKFLEVIVKAHSDKCYGTPGAPKGNAICFDYSTDVFSVVETNTRYITPPSSFDSLNLGTIKCHEFDVLEDTQSHTLTLTLTSNASVTTDHNISIFTDDIAFDLNQQNLNEIWGFTDEEKNQLGRRISSTADAIVYVS